MKETKKNILSQRGGMDKRCVCGQTKPKDFSMCEECIKKRAKWFRDFVNGKTTDSWEEWYNSLRW
jgi:hypothetical protein